ncbi:MAG: protein translocase subunit SecF [Anaerotignum sp.]|nr:protein translocase subunit SecF [Anaerotignum sp.]
MNVIENRKKFFILSLLIILIGFGAMFANYKAGNGIFNWDVEFTGGTSMEIDLGEAYDMTELEEIIREVTGQTSPQIQQILGTNGVRIRMQSVDSQTRMNLLNVLWDRYPSAELKESNDISGTVSREMQQAALKATLIAGAAMLLYISIRFRDFRAGSSAIIALIHDVLIVLAAYAVLRIPVNNGFIAVLLTVLGYSVNSTIVIFDRIRENKNKFKPYQMAERIDKSIGQTLSRSINTSLTTLFTIGAIYVIGVPSIKEFALPMMIGIIAGAYSSICISGPVWYSLMSKKTRELQYDK